MKVAMTWTCCSSSWPSRQAVADLIFLAGLSTSNEVSQVSGRGVGMDAVRTAVRRLGGRAAIASILGQGTVVTLSFPTAFTVSKIMIVDVAGEELERIEATAEAPTVGGVEVELAAVEQPALDQPPVSRLGETTGVGRLPE